MIFSGKWVNTKYYIYGSFPSDTIAESAGTDSYIILSRGKPLSGLDDGSAVVVCGVSGKLMIYVVIKLCILIYTQDYFKLVDENISSIYSPHIIC